MQELFPPPDPSPHAAAHIDWTPTRSAGLTRLAAFLPNAGRTYARDRNVDRGPEDRSNISGLSPWLRRRMVTEEEVIATVLRRHSYAAAEKFIQEVFWRTYWKGWLELRPAVWVRYQAECALLHQQATQDPHAQAAVQRAKRGETGIACFDAWARELVEIGWLHNHARMWFASIWIFTLKLPWQLGADFFYEHLLDADPASNTLSWRWVAGLQTVGKHYLARASNIRDNTLGRFHPLGQLDETAPPLRESAPMVTPGTLRPAEGVSERRVALLLHDEDLSPESLVIAADIAGIAALSPQRQDPSTRAPLRPAGRFAAGAIADGVQRAALHFGITPASGTLSAGEVAAWAQALSVKEVVSPCAPVGETAQALEEVSAHLAREGIRLVRLRREFDTRAWPLAKAGFFKFKEAIPQLITQGSLG